MDPSWRMIVLALHPHVAAMVLRLSGMMMHSAGAIPRLTASLSKQNPRHCCRPELGASPAAPGTLEQRQVTGTLGSSSVLGTTGRCKGRERHGGRQGAAARRLHPPIPPSKRRIPSDPSGSPDSPSRRRTSRSGSSSESSPRHQGPSYWSRQPPPRGCAERGSPRPLADAAGAQGSTL